MKAKFIEGFREWVIVMVVLLFAIFTANIIGMFMGIGTLDFEGFAFFLVFYTILFLIIKIIVEFIAFIVER